MESPARHQTFLEVDAVGTEHLVAAAREAGVGRVVYVSGAGAAPDAERHWFRAKWRAEEAIRGSGMTWTIVRPTWLYGPRDVSLNRFVGFARRLPAVPMTNFGNQLLAPAWVGDAAALVADALTDPAAEGQVLELGGPDTLPMREVIAAALRVAGLRRPILPGPALLLKLGSLPLTLLPGAAPHPGRGRLHQPAGDRRHRSAARTHAEEADAAGGGADDLPGAGQRSRAALRRVPDRSLSHQPSVPGSSLERPDDLGA